MTTRLRIARFAPAAGAALFFVLLTGPLLDPGRVLAARDVPQFHLPLRATLARLMMAGLPEWNPWIGGGQPLLSDPSYSAFYPTTWLALVVEPAFSLSLLVLLHLALALVGAWRLAERLGARPEVAAVAGIGWAGSGALLSFVHALNHLPGAAWLPWVLLAADAAFGAPNLRAAARPLCGLAGALAMTMLNGEPVTMLVGALGAACFALGSRAAASSASGPRAHPGGSPLGSFGRLALAGSLAASIAAIQLVPALGRLAASDRGEGLSWEIATGWSMPPARALELVLPRIYGDPLRSGEGLYFGWGVHDRGFPFVVSIYPSLPILVLGIAALARSRTPRRRAWLTMAVAGALLALGRHTPLYGWLFEYVPPFASLRYPEKFALLPAAALVFAGALGLEHLLAQRERGRRGDADLPLAFAGLAVALAIGALVVVRWAPTRVEDFVAANSGIPIGARSLAAALDFYRFEFGAALLISILTLIALALLRARRPAGRWIVAALALLVAGDLLRVHGRLIDTLPASAYDPSPLARQVAGSGERIWTTSDEEQGPEILLRGIGAQARDLSTRVARLDSWVGASWGLSYPLSTDFALMFTAPQRRAIGIARELRAADDRERFHRLLGAWGVSRTVIRKDSVRLAAEIRAGNPVPATATLASNPFVLPGYRFVGRAESHVDPAAARYAALASTIRPADLEHLVAPPWQGERTFDGSARVLRVEDAGDTLRLRVGTSGPALLVVATTYDRFWSARAGGDELPVVESALGYLAVPLPAGTRDVTLRYRDPWLRVGAAISFAALVGLALALRLLGRRGAAAPFAPAEESRAAGRSIP